MHLDDVRRSGAVVTVERLVMFGCAGSGKTTLARKLSARTGLMLVERDALGVLGSEAYRHACQAAAATPSSTPS